jgi:phospholipid/cholesterol/gamma-HCH transport system substrate-binding protein
VEGHTAQPVRRVPRRFQGRVNTVRAGLIALVLLVIATFLAFSKSLPWQQPFEFKAVFESANTIRLDSPVRISGVEVGRVTNVAHMDGSNFSVVTMKVNDDGLPIHKDATLKIRPRLFLEGNFFVDLQPGTPDRPSIDDGDTIPVTQTAYPVQLDQILTSLQSDNRKDLQRLLEGLGTGLNHQPTPGEDVGQDPEVRGLSGAQALNKSLNFSPSALKNGARVNNAFLGTQPHDLSKLIAGLQKFLNGLGRNEEQLKDFFTNFNTTMTALASEQASLRNTVRLLGPTAEHANKFFGHFAEALPPTREFVRAFIPGVRETGPTIRAAGPWLTQITALVGRPELGGLLRDLRPMTASFAKLVNASIGLYRQTDLTSRCFSKVILPAGDVVLQDGASTTGVPTFREFWYTVVGFAGESQDFDGNGQYTRVQTGGGPYTVKSGKLPGRPLIDSTLFGNSIAPPLGTRPKRPAKKPPYKPNFACYKNKVPDLNGPAAKPGPDVAVVSSTGGSR